MDDGKAYELKWAIYNESLAAVKKYHEAPARVEQQEQNRRRQELLGQ